MVASRRREQPRTRARPPGGLAASRSRSTRPTGPTGPGDPRSRPPRSTPSGPSVLLAVRRPALAAVAGVNVRRTGGEGWTGPGGGGRPPVTPMAYLPLAAWDDGMVTVTRDSGRVQHRVITSEELRADVDRVLSEEGLTFDRFVELGRSDELENPRLRDLWLLAGAILVGA